jgi:hypothetical protein
MSTIQNFFFSFYFTKKKIIFQIFDWIKIEKKKDSIEFKKFQTAINNLPSRDEKKKKKKILYPQFN